MASKNEKAGPQPVTDCNCLGNTANKRNHCGDDKKGSNNDE